MKKLTQLLALIIALALPSQALAATVGGSSGPIATTATVSGASSFSVLLYRNLANNAGPDFAGGTRTGLNFGTLEEQSFTQAGTGKVFKEMRSSNATGTASFAMVVTPNTHRRPYTINLTASRLISGANSIPAGAFTVTPIYAPRDNGNAAIPPTAMLEPAGPAVLKNTVYSSGSGGEGRTIQLVFGISGLDPNAGGDEAVPIDQPSGNYTGTVTLTLTLL